MVELVFARLLRAENNDEVPVLEYQLIVVNNGMLQILFQIITQHVDLNLTVSSKV